MRSCDYDEDVTTKGLQVASQILQSPESRGEVLPQLSPPSPLNSPLNNNALSNSLHNSRCVCVNVLRSCSPAASSTSFCARWRHTSLLR